MRELAVGLWHWQARHPEWREGEPWHPNVSSYALDDGERLLPFDPIAPPGELLERVAERETAVVLTAPWHERDPLARVRGRGSRGGRRATAAAARAAGRAPARDARRPVRPAALERALA